MQSIKWNNTRRNEGRSRGFTVIEIMVVIAVISLLSALTLAAFSLTRDNARRATCSSNLKQLYAASAMYAGDNNGLLPRYTTASNVTTRRDSGEATLPNEAHRLIEALAPYTRSKAIWKCPSDRMVAAARTRGDIHFFTSYYYNAHSAPILVNHESLCHLI